MNVDDLLEETVEYSNILIEAATAQASAADLGGLCNNISRHYRAMGIYDLLMRATDDGFHYGLISSALTRYYYLERCAREGAPADPEQIASFLDPFFDAVAADQIRLAGEIARLSPREWMEGFEYADDFAYSQVVFALAAGDGAVAPALRRYEASLNGATRHRLDVAQAIVDGDQRAFDESFWDLIEVERERMEAIADPEQDSILAQEYTFEANRWVFVEALALLRFAERAGLRTEAEYDRCPGVARRPAPRPFVPESYPNIPLP